MYLIARSRLSSRLLPSLDASLRHSCRYFRLDRVQLAATMSRGVHSLPGLVNVPLRLKNSPNAWDPYSGELQTPSRVASLTADQHAARASYYRGGTSRAILFKSCDIPADKSAWPDIFRGIIGSPDPENGRQLDGMGGGISSLSKVAVVGPAPASADHDVEYTFAAIDVLSGDVDFSANCGNILSAIGPFALSSKIMEVNQPSQCPADRADDDPIVPTLQTVRVLNTNTGKRIDATFHIMPQNTNAITSPNQVLPYNASSYGNFAIDGVAGTASPIRLDFLDPAGSKTGELFPTGEHIEQIEGIDATIIDASNPAVFVRAADLGVRGDLTPAEIDKNVELVKRLDRIRREAGRRMGLAASIEDVPGSIPKISMLAARASCSLAGGKKQDAAEIDLLCRTLSVGQPHKAIPITSALALAAAAHITGTVAHGVLSEETRDRIFKKAKDRITIGHAGGKIDVAATFDDVGALKSASVLRTARRIFEGVVYWRQLGDCDSQEE